MVISRTPFRVSFFGGGSDYKEFYERYGGSVLSATMNKYSYVTVRHYPAILPYRNQFTYSKIEHFNTPDELEHPLVREILKYLNVNDIQIAYDSDLPARSGVGSSSSFAVGLFNSLYTLNRKSIDKKTLAEKAIYAERVLCGETGGIQDQIAVAYGGFNRIDFNADGFSVNAVDIDNAKLSQLENNLLLFFTGFSRLSYEVAAEQKSRINENTATLRRMVGFVDDALDILQNGELDDFGLLLNESWQLKKSLASNISNKNIDDVYSLALSAGAKGGKLLGAGECGFMLFYVDDDSKKSVREKLSGLYEVPFRFEHEGSKIIYSGNE